MGLLNTIGLNSVPSWVLPFGTPSSCPLRPPSPILLASPFHPPPAPPIPPDYLHRQLVSLAPPVCTQLSPRTTSTPLCAGALSNGQQERCSLALALRSNKQFDNFGGFVEPHTRRLQPYIPRL